MCLTSHLTRWALPSPVVRHVCPVRGGIPPLTTGRFGTVQSKYDSGAQGKWSSLTLERFYGEKCVDLLVLDLETTKRISVHEKPHQISEIQTRLPPVQLIVDFDEQGQAHFADQEDGGQWYEYIPSEIERQMALQIAANGHRTGGWAVFIEMTDGA